MKFPLFLALRYLRPRGSFVSIITLISVLGVVLGVAILVLVISVMSGFEKKMREIVLGFEPHIEAEFYPHPDEVEEFPPSGWREQLEVFQKQPGVTRAVPLIVDSAFLEREGVPVGTALKGVRPEDFTAESEMAKQILHGDLELRGDSVVLGLGLAERLGVTVGDEFTGEEVITLYSSGNIQEGFAAMKKYRDSESETESDAALEELDRVVLPYELTVRGVFDRSLQFDHQAVVPIHICQEVLGMGDEVKSIGIWTEDPDRAPLYAMELVEVSAPGWGFWPWMEKPAIRQLFSAVRSERAMMYMVLFAIVLVAAFSIMNTIITVTVQKRREIGVITALGGRVGQVMWVFVLQGAVVGFIGSLLGLATGLLVVHFRNGIQAFLRKAFQFEVFDPKTYGIAEIPAHIRIEDLVLITVGSFLMCTVAAILPAWLAARIDPARALRNE